MPPSPKDTRVGGRAGLCHPHRALAGEAAGGQLLPRHDGQGCEKHQGAGAAASCSRRGSPRPRSPKQKQGAAGGSGVLKATPPPHPHPSRCCPGSGRGGCHPVPAVAGEDGPAGAGGRVFGGTAHRRTPPVSAATTAPPAQRRAAGDPQHLPPRRVAGRRSTAEGPALRPSRPAGSTRRWPTTGTAQPWGRGWGARAGSNVGVGSPHPPIPSQPLQREQPAAVCGRDVPCGHRRAVPVRRP